MTQSKYNYKLPYECGRRTSGGMLHTDTCRQGGGGVTNLQNLADVFYGWPPTVKLQHFSVVILANKYV